jgi:hypothetical protein
MNTERQDQPSVNPAPASVDEAQRAKQEAIAQAKAKAQRKQEEKEAKGLPRSIKLKPKRVLEWEWGPYLYKQLRVWEATTFMRREIYRGLFNADTPPYKTGHDRLQPHTQVFGAITTYANRLLKDFSAKVQILPAYITGFMTKIYAEDYAARREHILVTGLDFIPIGGFPAQVEIRAENVEILVNPEDPRGFLIRVPFYRHDVPTKNGGTKSEVVYVTYVIDPKGDWQTGSSLKKQHRASAFDGTPLLERLRTGERTMGSLKILGKFRYASSSEARLLREQEDRVREAKKKNDPSVVKIPWEITDPFTVDGVLLPPYKRDKYKRRVVYEPVLQLSYYLPPLPPERERRGLAFCYTDPDRFMAIKIHQNFERDLDDELVRRSLFMSQKIYERHKLLDPHNKMSVMSPEQIRELVELSDRRYTGIRRMTRLFGTGGNSKMKGVSQKIKGITLHFDHSVVKAFMNLVIERNAAEFYYFDADRRYMEHYHWFILRDYFAQACKVLQIKFHYLEGWQFSDCQAEEKKGGNWDFNKIYLRIRGEKSRRTRAEHEKYSQEQYERSLADEKP